MTHVYWPFTLYQALSKRFTCISSDSSQWPNDGVTTVYRGGNCGTRSLNHSPNMFQAMSGRIKIWIQPSRWELSKCWLPLMQGVLCEIKGWAHWTFCLHLCWPFSPLSVCGSPFRARGRLNGGQGRLWKQQGICLALTAGLMGFGHWNFPCTPAPLPSFRRMKPLREAWIQRPPQSPPNGSAFYSHSFTALPPVIQPVSPATYIFPLILVSWS